MHTSLFRKPLLPSHYSVWSDPPDEAGDEVLHIVSERRALKLKGHSFREFQKKVVPLLDGRHTVEQIESATQEVFRPEDLEECFQLLAGQGVLVEAEELNLPPAEEARRLPQSNFFREVAPGLDLEGLLTKATVAVIGLGGAGAATALALGAAGIGVIECLDPLPLAAADVYLAPFFALSDVGGNRADLTVRSLAAASPEVKARAGKQSLESEEEIRTAISGADYVVCCLDSSQSNLIFKLNRVCLAVKVPWISCALSGAEVVVGPAIHPGEGPCYMCYRMRAVACAGNPEEAFAYERFLDRRKRDDSGRKDNLVFGAGLAANFMGLEVVKHLTQIAESSLSGRILTIRLLDLAMERHTVLRKPFCPACFPAPEDTHAH